MEPPERDGRGLKDSTLITRELLLDGFFQQIGREKGMEADGPASESEKKTSNTTRSCVCFHPFRQSKCP